MVINDRSIFCVVARRCRPNLYTQVEGCNNYINAMFLPVSLQQHVKLKSINLYMYCVVRLLTCTCTYHFEIVFTPYMLVFWKNALLPPQKHHVIVFTHCFVKVILHWLMCLMPQWKVEWTILLCSKKLPYWYLSIRCITVSL